LIRADLQELEKANEFLKMRKGGFNPHLISEILEPVKGSQSICSKNDSTKGELPSRLLYDFDHSTQIQGKRPST